MAITRGGGRANVTAAAGRGGGRANVAAAPAGAGTARGRGRANVTAVGGNRRQGTATTRSSGSTSG